MVIFPQGSWGGGGGGEEGEEEERGGKEEERSENLCNGTLIAAIWPLSPSTVVLGM